MLLMKQNRNSTTSSRLLQKMASWTHSVSKECLSIALIRSNQNNACRQSPLQVRSACRDSSSPCPAIDSYPQPLEPHRHFQTFPRELPGDEQFPNSSPQG
jgi:hypothetical protein